jgi:hypothetical protein
MAFRDPFSAAKSLSHPNKQTEIMMRIASEFDFTPASRSRILSFDQANSLLVDADTHDSKVRLVNDPDKSPRWHKTTNRAVVSIRRPPGNSQDNFSTRMPLESVLKCLTSLLDRQHAVHERA